MPARHYRPFVCRLVDGASDTKSSKLKVIERPRSSMRPCTVRSLKHHFDNKHLQLVSRRLDWERRGHRRE